MTPHATFRRTMLAIAAATGTLLATATGTTTAGAAETQPAGHDAARHAFDWSALATPANGPAEHTAGSQIRKHLARTGSAHAADPVRPAGAVQGIDVSRHQPGVDWPRQAGRGVRFAYVKATEGHDYTSPTFDTQYDGAYDAGIRRGAYHFAIPNDGSSAIQQARYFLAHGGSWTSDGRTLPPMLDLEYNPYGDSCYGLSTTRMRAWIGTFSAVVHRRTGRFPTVYTNRDWWNTCTGDWTGLASTNPLFVARYGTATPGELPGGWTHWTIWQYANAGPFPGDQDYFHAGRTALHAFASGSK